MMNLSWLLLGLISLTLPGCAPQPLSDPATAPLQRAGASPDDFMEQRRLLVERISSQGVSNKAVLGALMKVPRHRFVPPPYKHLAYADRPLPIGQGQTISQPFIVAYMTEASEVAPGEKVLEIGTGSGYQAAVLSEIAREVYSVEIIPALAEGARALLQELGYKNVYVKAGNGYEGWAEHAPFDAIVVTAAPDQVPQALINQLAVDGKMVIPVGSANQEMVEITKTASGVVEKRTIPVRFVPMTGKPTN
jgi:protein-L-isoaspartate(D-aspartate) O-methyltransferase